MRDTEFNFFALGLGILMLAGVFLKSDLTNFLLAIGAYTAGWSILSIIGKFIELKEKK